MIPELLLDSMNINKRISPQNLLSRINIKYQECQSDTLWSEMPIADLIFTQNDTIGFVFADTVLKVKSQGNPPVSIGDLCKDTASMKCYQTFDEYTMKGNGQAAHSPYVYVKTYNDSIVVFSSNKKDSARTYVKQTNNVWYNHMEYDMWKKSNYVPSKDKLSKTARTYDRFFYNDTIMEVETDYISGRQYQQLIIKCKNNLYVIRNVDYLDCSKFEELRKMATNLIFLNDKRVSKYVLIEKKDRYVYVEENNSNSYSYERKAYGLWGIQPGIEETCLYGGIDIRDYSDNLKNYQLYNSDNIYEVADEMPKFPGGTSNFYEFVKTNRTESLILNENRPRRVILEVVIEKDGSITNPKILKSIDPLHDNEALNIIRRMPKWTPAKLNGDVIRYKMLIPISYN